MYDSKARKCKKKFYNLISFSSLSDPDPKQIVKDPDPDAGKSYGSDRIRIRNTEIKLKNPSGGYTLTLLLFNQNLFNTKKDNDNNLVFFFFNQRVPYHLLGSFELGMNPLNDRMLQ